MYLWLFSFLFPLGLLSLHICREAYMFLCWKNKRHFIIAAAFLFLLAMESNNFEYFQAKFQEFLNKQHSVQCVFNKNIRELTVALRTMWVIFLSYCIHPYMYNVWMNIFFSAAQKKMERLCRKWYISRRVFWKLRLQTQWLTRW